MKVTTNVDLDQLWLNYAKAYRNQVRLKHSIRADNEINQKLGAVKLQFDRQVQKGLRPAPPVFAATGETPPSEPDGA